MTKDSGHWDERYAEAGRLWSGEPNTLLVDVATGLPRGRALELGSGEGADAIWLAEQGWQVTAVDISGVALDRAAEAAKTRGVSVRWVLADLREYAPPERSFDLVATLYLHLPPAQRRAFLARAVTALAPGGALLVVGHDRSQAEEAPGPRDPDRLFTPELIVADLPGLVVARAERIARKIAVDGREVVAVDTLVLARRGPQTAERDGRSVSIDPSGTAPRGAQ